MTTDPRLAARIEELLREQLEDMGENPHTLEPHHIAQSMRCEVYPDKSMLYSWKGRPILRVVPEAQPDGTTRWRMFTDDVSPAPTQEADHDNAAAATLADAGYGLPEDVEYANATPDTDPDDDAEAEATRQRHPIQ